MSILPIFNTNHFGVNLSENTIDLLYSPATTLFPFIKALYPIFATVSGFITIELNNLVFCICAFSANSVRVAPGHNVVTVMPVPSRFVL